MTTILYIDDDMDDLDFFEDVIQDINPDYAVHCFDESTEAVAFLEKSIIIPGIIFLDINMPKLSGKETLQLIRQNTNYASVPIVMYSTSIHESEKKAFLDNGATAFLRKGYSLDSSIDEIESILNEHLK